MYRAALAFSYALLITGSLLFLDSLRFEPYKDPALFHREYAKMSAGNSAEYQELRNHLLTSKYTLQDYGITLAGLGIFGLLGFRSRLGFHSPKHSRSLLLMLVAAPFATFGSFVYDLAQGSNRGEFPHWAESIGIPLTGALAVLFILLAWAALHALFFRKPYLSSTPLINSLSFKANKWLLVLIAVAAILTVISLCYGQYWFAAPCLFWLYVYSSMAAGFRAFKDS